MYKTILVPLDGSKRAEAILPHVEELAQRYDARVVFTRIVEPPPLVIPPGQPDATIYWTELEQRTEEAELYLKGMQGEFENKGIDSRMDLGKGAVVEAIAAAAKRHDVDLIALASHGHTGLAQVFYGSVAAGVLQRVDRPLLLIRSNLIE